jgi:hypothetical protein
VKLLNSVLAYQCSPVQINAAVRDVRAVCKQTTSMQAAGRPSPTSHPLPPPPPHTHTHLPPPPPPSRHSPTQEQSDAAAKDVWSASAASKVLSLSLSLAHTHTHAQLSTHSEQPPPPSSVPRPPPPLALWNWNLPCGIREAPHKRYDLCHLMRVCHALTLRAAECLHDGKGSWWQGQGIDPAVGVTSST